MAFTESERSDNLTEPSGFTARIREDEEEDEDLKDTSASGIIQGGRAKVVWECDVFPQAGVLLLSPRAGVLLPQAGVFVEVAGPQVGVLTEEEWPQAGVLAEVDVSQAGVRADPALPQAGVRAEGLLPQAGVREEPLPPQAGVLPPAPQAGVRLSFQAGVLPPDMPQAGVRAPSLLRLGGSAVDGASERGLMLPGRETLVLETVTTRLSVWSSTRAVVSLMSLTIPTYPL